MFVLVQSACAAAMKQVINFIEIFISNRTNIFHYICIICFLSVFIVLSSIVLFTCLYFIFYDVFDADVL